ncbi:MAG: RNA pyrophosphohydrolase [Alphaproteobacteria bacterium]
MSRDKAPVQSGHDIPVAGLPYRRGVGVILLNRRGQVFVAQRIDMPSAAWQMPQGGIDPGETPRQAAVRELCEETGVKEAEIIAESRDWIRYDLPADLVPKLWGGRYRGQEQKWFAMCFLGTDADIDIDGEQPEFNAWRWVELAEVPDLIVPFKRALYRELVVEFNDIVAATRES